MFKFKKKSKSMTTDKTPQSFYAHVNPFYGAPSVTMRSIGGALVSPNKTKGKDIVIPVGNIANRIRFMQMDNQVVHLIINNPDKYNLTDTQKKQLEIAAELIAVIKIIKSYITEINEKVNSAPGFERDFSVTLDITPILNDVYKDSIKGNEEWFETFANFCNVVQANIEEWAKGFHFDVLGSINALSLVF